MITKLFIRALFVFLVTSVVLTPLSVQPVYAADDGSEQKKKKRLTKRALIISQKVSKILEGVQKMADEKRYQDALEELDDTLELRLSDYEKALAYNMKAYMYFATESYSKAQQAYENVVKLEKVPDGLLQTAQLSLAKAYLIEEKYKQSLDAINVWFGMVDKISPDPYVLRAQIKFQLKDYKGALPDVKKAIAMAKAENKVPKENWLLVERAVYFQNNDFVALERCLKDLISLYPKEQYWTQLSYVYAELGKQGKSLVTLETAYEQNLLEKENQIMSLAQYMLAEETPYKAANVILKGMKSGKVEESGKNLSLLGDALMMAKEYDQAITVMTQAAKETQKSEDFYKLAQIHSNRQEWQSALSNINQALEDNDFKYYSDAKILKGLVLFNLNQLDKAKAVFTSISKADPDDRTSQQWLAYIEGEQKRRDYMAQ